MTILIPKFDLKNGGSTPAGAVNRPINEKLEEVISVKDFGAVGDGITDDTAAIQAALNAVAPTRKALYIPAGNYKTTQPLDVTVSGFGFGGLIYGDGYASTITYYPPVGGNVPGVFGPTTDGSGGFCAGALNIGNDNYKGYGVTDLRIVRGGPDKNLAAGLTMHRWYQGYIRNVVIEGFEMGIQIVFGWSNAITDCKISDCTYGISWNNITIGTMRGNDISTCNIGIYFGWNLFGQTTEPTLFAQGVTVCENTIQGCSEAAIVGKNLQNINVYGNYTERNCAGPYPTLESSKVVNAVTYNSCEQIYFSDNVYGNSNIVIQNNWLTAHEGFFKYAFGFGDTFAFTWQNNNAYTIPYIQGEPGLSAVITGINGKIETDTFIDRSSGSGSVQSTFLRAFNQTLPYIANADLPSTETIAIAAGTSQTILFPMNSINSVAFSQVTLQAPSLPAGLTFKFAVYVNYTFNNLIRVVLANNVPAYAGTAIFFAFPSLYILPEGDTYVGFEVTNPTGSPINFVYNSLQNFAANETTPFRVASAAPGVLTQASVSAQLQPGQVMFQ
jgi:hypothetical protein